MQVGDIITMVHKAGKTHALIVHIQPRGFKALRVATVIPFGEARLTTWPLDSHYQIEVSHGTR